MLRTDDSPGKMPTSEATSRRRLRARRDQQAVGLIPRDARTGYMILGVCDRCGELTGGNIMLVCARGGSLRWDCDCGSPQSHTLGEGYPLAPIGGDSVDGGPDR